VQKEYTKRQRAKRLLRAMRTNERIDVVQKRTSDVIGRQKCLENVRIEARVGGNINRNAP
jgi:hypothetical protein